MQKDYKSTGTGSGGLSPAFAVVLAVLISLALPLAVLADALSAAYEAPNFDAPLFERDALSLRGDERSEVVAALVAVTQNLPSAPNIDTDVKEKAIAIALRLDPLDPAARSAHESLLPSFAGTSDGATLSSTIRFASGAEVFAVLSPQARELWQQRAQPDDEVLATLLLEIALTILSETEWQVASVQEAAQVYRGMCAATDPISLWADVVELQPIPGDGASKLATRLRNLPSSPVAISSPPQAVPAAIPPTMATPTAPPSTSSSSSSPALPAAASTNTGLEVKRSQTVVPFVFLEGAREGAAGGTLRLNISPLDETERSLFGLFGDKTGPPEMRLTVGDEGRRSVAVTGFAAAESWARNTFSAWPQAQTGRIELRRERVDVANDAADIISSPEPQNVSLPLALLLHSAFSGQQIDTGFALSGQLSEDGSLSAQDNFPMSQVLEKFAAYGDKLAIAAVATLPPDDESLRDALVLEEVELFVAPQTVTVQSVAQLVEVAVADQRPQKLRDAMTLFSEVEKLDDLAGNLSNPFVREKLRQVIELWPAHLSAEMLLLAGDIDKRPALLSRHGSVKAVNWALAPLRETYEADPGSEGEFFDVNELVAESRLRLHSVENKLHPDARNYRLGAEDLIVLFNDYLSLKNRDASNANAEQHRRNLDERLRSLELLAQATH